MKIGCCAKVHGYSQCPNLCPNSVNFESSDILLFFRSQTGMYVVAPFLANKSIIFTIERANELFVRLLTRVEFASMMAQENVRNGNIAMYYASIFF